MAPPPLLVFAEDRQSIARLEPERLEDLPFGVHPAAHPTLDPVAINISQTYLFNKQSQSLHVHGVLLGDNQNVAVTSYSLIVTQKHAVDRKSTRLNSSHIQKSRMPSSA